VNVCPCYPEAHYFVSLSYQGFSCQLAPVKRAASLKGVVARFCFDKHHP